MLMNSPTFNTLDNRFENHADTNHFQIGTGPSSPANQSPKDSPKVGAYNINQQYFAESTWAVQYRQNDRDKGIDNQGTEEGPRIASPSAFEFEPVEEESQANEKPLLSSLIKFDRATCQQMEPFPYRESLTSNANRSDKSKRAQPSQKASLQAKQSGVKQEQQSKNESISPPRSIKTPFNDVKSRSRSKKSTPYRKNRAETADEMCEGRSPMLKTLNMVSSDLIESSPYNASAKGRSNVLNRGKTHDGYKKMNKVPYEETLKIVQHNSVKEQKHSAYQVSRTRVPSIAQYIEIEADLNRLNLKTREENMNKRNQLIRRAEQARNSFNISIDYSPNRVVTSGNTTIKHRSMREQMTKLQTNRDSNKIETKFLKQSEMLRLKPDNFRRVSIQTDLEFGGGTHAVTPTNNVILAAALKPLSKSRVTTTIMEQEHERGNDEDGESMWGMTESQSSSILPKTRHVYKQVKIRESVLRSRNESSRIADILSNPSQMAPSIRKALKDRANFYRRKLQFYENLDVLAISMTSNEIQAKLNEGACDFNSSNANSLFNVLQQSRKDESNFDQVFSNRLSQQSNGFGGRASQQLEQQPAEPAFELPKLCETPKEMTIMSGSGELQDPVAKTDFRPKDMSLRRSRILQTLDPINNTDCSQLSYLPKSLPRKAGDQLETVLTDRPDNAKNKKRRGVHIFSTLISAKNDSVSREYSLPSASESPRPTVPNSRSQFKRVNIPQIAGTQNQVWRRVNNQTPMQDSFSITPTPKMPALVDMRMQRMPDLTDARKKLPQNSKLPSRNVSQTHREAATQRNTSNPSQKGSGVRDVIKDLLVKHQPVHLPKTKVLNQDRKQQKLMLPPKKIKISNKLKISPLNQELKNLGPMKLPVQPQPVFVKYSHRELPVPPKSVSPTTQVDPSKPRLITKDKAKKLVLLQKTINQL